MSKTITVEGCVKCPINGWCSFYRGYKRGFCDLVEGFHPECPLSDSEGEKLYTQGEVMRAEERGFRKILNHIDSMRITHPSPEDQAAKVFSNTLTHVCDEIYKTYEKDYMKKKEITPDAKMMEVKVGYGAPYA